jgi:hypothetical protein
MRVTMLHMLGLVVVRIHGVILWSGSGIAFCVNSIISTNMKVFSHVLVVEDVIVDVQQKLI